VPTIRWPRRDQLDPTGGTGAINEGGENSNEEAMMVASSAGFHEAESATARTKDLHRAREPDEN
jgi:hypothetical protein